VAAAVALHAQKAVLQETALQVVFEFLANELRKVAVTALALVHEPRVMFSNNGIERGLFRSMPVVGRRDGDRGRSRHWA